MAHKSQVQRVLDVLWAGGWHCTSKFYADYMADPRRRMVDLRDKGYELESRPCKAHKHDGPTKEWRIKTAPANRYPFKVYIGSKVYEIKTPQEEEKWRAYQAKKGALEPLSANSN